MAIDYGLKRTGISVTDRERIIVTGLETVETNQLLTFLQRYVNQEPVDEFVVGYPFVEGSWGEPRFKVKLDEFISTLKQKFPSIILNLHDERFSSMRAKEIMLQGGKKSMSEGTKN